MKITDYQECVLNAVKHISESYFDYFLEDISNLVEELTGMKVTTEEDYNELVRAIDEGRFSTDVVDTLIDKFEIEFNDVIYG